jgi:lipopolysaccharide biosynthesis glycosyltransferase
MGDWMTLISTSSKESGKNRKSATFSKRMADWMALVSSSEREEETGKKLSTFNVEEMGCSYQICYFKKSLEISNIHHEIVSQKNYRKDLVYICLFGDVKYAILANLMFESILLNCENDISFDIIIYTSTEIRKKIIESSLVSKLRINRRLIFNINDNIRTKAEACSSRLDLFSFPQIKNYRRILYLDSDVIVIQNLAPFFNLIKEDKFYVLKETEDMTKSDNYYGRDLFGKEIFNYQDKSGFNSGLLLFNNCETIKNLFLVIRTDMNRREKQNPFYDQPFFNYNAKKLNVSESNVLISYVLPSLKFLSLYRNKSVYPLNGTSFGRNRKSTEQNITVIHFLGGVEAHASKISEMKRFLSELKRSTNGFILMTN